MAFFRSFFSLCFSFFARFFSIFSLRAWMRLFWVFVFLIVSILSFSIAHVLSLRKLHSLQSLMDMPFASGSSALLFDHVRSLPVPFDSIPLDNRFVYTDLLEHYRLTPSLVLYRLSVRLESSSFCCLLLLVDTDIFEKKEILLITEDNPVHIVSTAEAKHSAVMVGHLDFEEGIFTTRYDFFVPDGFSLRSVFSASVRSNAMLFSADKEGYIHEIIAFSYEPAQKTLSNPDGYPIITSEITHQGYGGRTRSRSISYAYDARIRLYSPIPSLRIP